MTGKQMASDSFASNLAGMSKNQLYDIMSQMKVLIEQNEQQARNILVENPTLTKALFQAQIMLGMVKPPRTAPSIQQAPTPQPPQQPVHHPPSSQPQMLPPQVSQELTSGVPIPIPTRKQPPNNPVLAISSAPPIQPLNHHQSHSQQSMQPSKGQQHMSTQGQGIPVSTQLVHIQNMLPHQQLHPSQQPPPSYHHSQVHNISMQQQPPPPLPSQPRPQASMQPYHPQMNPHGGYQTPQQQQQPQYQNPNRQHPGNIGYAQGGQGQPPLPNQPPPQPMYQVSGPGSHMGIDYGNQQGGGGPMQVDRSQWMQPGPPDVAQQQQQLPGPPPLPGQMGPGSQPPPRPAQIPNEVEKQLLQQVMSLTPEQINLLPPEQRHQVFQLQQMMR